MRRSLTLVFVFLVAGCGQTARPEVAAGCAPQVIAHRGEPAVAPEETMRSFRAAVDHGAPVLEGDIQFTRDGRAILLHDETVDRTTDGTGPVKDLSLAQVRTLDAGHGAQVPSLTELLSLGRERSVDLVIELKSGGVTPSQVETVLGEVKAESVQKQTIIESLSIPALDIVQRLDPSMQTALITNKAVSGTTARASGTSLLPNIKVVTRAKVKEWHDAGVKVYPWTPDDVAGWSKARQAGVDGVVTDRTTDYLSWAAKGCRAP